MKKIIGVIRPFDMKQILLVYEDGNKIDAHESTIENLHSGLFQLMDKHETYQVDLTGPKTYLKGLKEQLTKVSLIEYSKHPITINII